MKGLLLFLFIGLFIKAETKAPARIAKFYTKPNIGLVTFALQKEDQLVKVDKQRMLDIHNALRNYLALGKETHSNDGHGGHQKMPQAADMQAMSWDDNLATYAQNWANTEPGSKHSTLKNDPLLKEYHEGMLAESLSGDITAQERDMYGEVAYWNYDSFECRSDKQCGHYLAFANAQFTHLGCGYKRYKTAAGVETATVVCVYGGNNPTSKGNEKRLPYQHEYTKGKPCSKCQQGWNYCMGGGLCATKTQCESYSGNHCKCLHDKDTCETNGGTFSSDQCTCTCPSNRMGINCAQSCANTKTGCYGCSKDSNSKYLCEKDCGSCGKSKSAAYVWTFDDRKLPNEFGIMTRWQMEDNDAQASKNTPHGQKYCKNADGNKACETLKYRGYCNDFMLKMMVRYGCKLSCNQVCKKPETGPTDADFNSLLSGADKKLGKSSSAVSGDLAALLKGGGSGGSLGGSASKTPSKGTDAASALNSLGLGGMSGLGDLSGFNVVRRRRR